MRIVIALLLFLLPTAALAQEGPAQLQLGDIGERLQRDGRVELRQSGIVIEQAGFDHGGAAVEAIVVRPTGDEPRAGLVLVPGHSRTAYDLLPQAIRFARAGFATIAVSQPGYGGSAGPADFAGPRTYAALLAAAERFAALPFVDRARLGIYGYSRGALAAAQLAARTDLFRASVLGGGVYDFGTALEQVTLEGIRANMIAEVGTGAEAMRVRSPIHDMAGVDGPVLIVHGERDENAPPAQARALADRLAALGKPHELVIIPGAGHALGMSDIIVPAIRFFTEHLQPAPARPQANRSTTSASAAIASSSNVRWHSAGSRS